MRSIDPWKAISTCFGNTCIGTDYEFAEMRRTQLEPPSWTCDHCNTVNPREQMHCGHCGAPHTAACDKGAHPYDEDPSEWEPDVDAEYEVLM